MSTFGRVVSKPRAVAWLGAFTLALTLVGCGGGDNSTSPLFTQDAWFSSWGASQNIAEFPAALNDSTARMIVRPSVSGQALRVKLENTHGKAPVSFSGVFIGVAGSGAALVAGTNKPLTFNGRPDVLLAPGAGTYSDPVYFEVKAFERLAVSLNVATASDASSHSLGLTTNYLAPGRRGAEE